MMTTNRRAFARKPQGLWLAAVFSLALAFPPLTLHAQQAPPPMRIDLEQAIRLAIAHNHALKAAQNTIQQSEAEEITAAIRPNPVLTYDDLYVPIFNPSQLNGTTLDNIAEFDLGFSYTFERGHKRGARIEAARDATAVTRCV